MEYVNDININEAVVHVLDGAADEPILNEYSLELDEDIYTFLYKHINKCLKSDELKYARFNQGIGTLKALTQEYLTGKTNDLIEISKEIARQLFMIMKSNCNIPSSDLIISSITTDQGPMIAILKMDYVKNFTHEVVMKNDKLGVALVPQAAGLPTSSQRIQKAAFIKPVREDEKFNIYVLDNQKSSKEEEYGANYFVKTFLNSMYVTNERDMTRDFINNSENWIRKYITEDAAAAEEVRNKIKDKLKEEDVINVDEVSKEIFEHSPEQEESFAREIKMKCNLEEVKVDKVYIEKKFRRVRLNIDKQIDLYINEDVYKDKSKYEVVKNGDGTVNLVVKNVLNYIEK